MRLQSGLLGSSAKNLWIDYKEQYKGFCNRSGGSNLGQMFKTQPKEAPEASAPQACDH